MSETTTTDETQASLQISDLVLVAKVIQASVQRGAIKAEEMSAVGQLYDKLVTFLEAAGAVQRKGATPPESNGEQNA